MNPSGRANEDLAALRVEPATQASYMPTSKMAVMLLPSLTPVVPSLQCRAQPQQQCLRPRAGQQRCLQRQHRGALARPWRQGLGVRQEARRRGRPSLLPSPLNHTLPKVAMAGLKDKTKYVRSQIGKRMKLHLTPEIRFIEDESMERGRRHTCFGADPSVVITFEDDEDTAGAVGLSGGFHHYHIVVTY